MNFISAATLLLLGNLIGSAIADQGLCLSAHDISICNDHQKMIDLTAKCGYSCRGEEGCTADCIDEGSGVSYGCARCYAQDASCTARSCMTSCFFNPKSEQCQQCAYTKCGSSFKKCSGIVPRPPASIPTFAACSMIADMAILSQQNQLDSIIDSCAFGSRGNVEGAIKCIQKQSGLSDSCGECVGHHSHCVSSMCTRDCFANPLSVNCKTCIKENCDASLEQCSGVAYSTTLAAIQCSAEDIAKIPQTGSTIAKVKDCSMKCMGGSRCTSVCLQQALGISMGCAQCFGNEAECGRNHCMSACVFNPDSSRCHSCVIEHCGKDFTACSGIVEKSGIMFDGVESRRENFPTTVLFSNSRSMNSEIIDCIKSCHFNAACTEKCTSATVSGQLSSCVGTFIRCASQSKCSSLCQASVNEECVACALHECGGNLEQCLRTSMHSLLSLRE